MPLYLPAFNGRDVGTKAPNVSNEQETNYK